MISDPTSKPKIEIRPSAPPGRSGATVLFGIWGILGLFISIFAGLGAPILTAIYIALMWMAGVLFFGIAHLASNVSYRISVSSLPVHVVEPPRIDGFEAEYNGVPYTQLDGGQIMAEFADGRHTFKNWKKFIQAVPE